MFTRPFAKDIVLPSGNSKASEARPEVSWSKTCAIFLVRRREKGKRKEVVLTSSLT